MRNLTLALTGIAFATTSAALRLFAPDPAAGLAVPFCREALRVDNANAYRWADLGEALSNAAIAKAGYPNAQYRLYKVAGKQQGQYSHLWESSWSGRAEYEKIHNLSVYQEASSHLKDLMPLMKDEAYNRFVEIPTKQ